MANELLFLGNCQVISGIKQKLPLISASGATVCITGETGTGKEVLAKTIHRQSPRSNKLFIPLNCGGIPKELVEDELFGHMRGAYTQAFENRKGLIEEASGGTLFLDEIDSLPLDVQPKFLRILEEREFRIIGDNKFQKADVRFIVASNVNLEECVRNNTFRADLFYRLSVLLIHLPPLRERKEDIPELVEYFVKNFGDLYGKKDLLISNEALACLLSYNWPGNIRELQHAVHRAVLWCQEKELQPIHFELPRIESKPDLQDWDQSFHNLKKHLLNRFEVEYISKLLKTHRGNISSAARAAKLNRRTFQRLMVKHRLRRID